jgi:hypothetical protein
MDNIIEPNELFDFSKLSLAHPTGVQGGAYFTKIEHNKKPLYIQTLKGQTKQGFVKTGKKYYCDLMYDKNAETLINWFENLEERCRKLIYEKRNDFEFEFKESIISELQIELMDDQENYLNLNNQHWNLVLQINYVREIEKDIKTSFHDIVLSNYSYNNI